jgi:hypothetical protein
VNVTCDKCQDNDPDCKSCHGHPYVPCKEAGCVMWMRPGYEAWKSADEVLREAGAHMAGAREYATQAMPMSTFGDLLKEGETRYTGAGNGPWQKTEKLDQIDLVFCDNMAEFLTNSSGLSPDSTTLGHCVARLVKELRAERGWPTPPKVEPNFKYADEK